MAEEEQAASLGDAGAQTEALRSAINKATGASLVGGAFVAGRFAFGCAKFIALLYLLLRVEAIYGAVVK